MTTPFPPFSQRLLAPKFGAGMDRGETRRTGNTVDHTMLGTLTGTDAYFRLPHIHASTHWGIGGSLDGELDGAIYQWIEMGSDMIPWASGPWRGGDGDGPAYVREFGVYGINALAESIELSGQIATPLTVKQWRSLIWLHAAIAHDAGDDSEHFEWNMHHWEFCGKDYKGCPWPRVENYVIEHQAATIKIMQFYEGLPMHDEFVIIAGLRVPLPLGKSPVPVPVPPTAPIFVPFEKPRRAVMWNATGRQYGNRDATIIRTYRDGDKIWFDGYYNGESVNGDNRWYVVDSNKRERVHSSGIKLWLADEPERFKQFSPFKDFFPPHASNVAGAGPHWRITDA